MEFFSGPFDGADVGVGDVEGDGEGRLDAEVVAEVVGLGSRARPAFSRLDVLLGEGRHVPHDGHEKVGRYVVDAELVPAEGALVLASPAEGAVRCLLARHEGAVVEGRAVAHVRDGHRDAVRDLGVVGEPAVHVDLLAHDGVDPPGIPLAEFEAEGLRVRAGTREGEDRDEGRAGKGRRPGER